MTSMSTPNNTKDIERPDEAQEERLSVSSPLVVETLGSLFDAPDGSGLIHACNSQGSWGKGIATTFRERYPAAYQVYRDHCLKFKRNPASHHIRDLGSDCGSSIPVPYPDGSALIIAPQKGDGCTLNSAHSRTGTYRNQHWIICLFTSHSYGARKDPPSMIMNKTAAALHDLKQQLAIRRESQPPEQIVAGLFACRFNSGLFKVPWEETCALIEQMGIEMTVMVPVDENEG